MKISPIKAGGTPRAAGTDTPPGSTPRPFARKPTSPLPYRVATPWPLAERGNALRLQASLLPEQEDDGLLGQRIWRALLEKHGLASIPYRNRELGTVDAKQVHDDIIRALMILSDGDSIWPRITHSCQDGDPDGFKALLVLVRSNAIISNPKAAEFDRIRTALLKAGDLATSGSENRIPVFERICLLAEAGMDLTMRTNDRQTLLHLAAGENARPEVLDALIAQGHYINSMNGNDQTPLHACLAGRPLVETVEFLLSRGASTTARNSMEETPLSVAAAYDIDIAVVKALIDAGNTRQDDINSADSKGWTALHNASLGNNRDAAIVLLLENGADPNLEDSNGDTPRYLYTKYPDRTWDFV